MTTHSERLLKTGGDPRTLADYAALRDEMNKLTHPARPDVNWQYAEKLCLSLFEHNGVELQTAAWYTLARAQLAGLYGLNEGLAILETLVAREWGIFWPQPVHARLEILSALNKRLLQLMRTLTLTHADLSQVYQAENHLHALGEVLQRLELKHAGQLDALRILMHNAAVRLENSDGATGSDNARQKGIAGQDETVILANASFTEPAEYIKRVYVAQPETLQNVDEATERQIPAKPWKPFAAGMLTMLMLAGVATGGWRAMHRPDPAQAQFAATLAPLPAALTAEQLQMLRQQPPSAEAGIRQTQQQLARLLQLKPDWAASYGESLVQQALTLWPEQAKPLAQQWQQQLNAAALPAENLNGWHQGMMQLQLLANRLNALDEQKGKYMTVSELKSAVFAITQSFNRAVPAQELLRELSAIPQGQLSGAAQQRLAEQHLQQLIARYALLKQTALE